MHVRDSTAVRRLTVPSGSLARDPPARRRSSDRGGTDDGWWRSPTWLPSRARPSADLVSTFNSVPRVIRLHVLGHLATNGRTTTRHHQPPTVSLHASRHWDAMSCQAMIPTRGLSSDYSVVSLLLSRVQREHTMYAKWIPPSIQSTGDATDLN